MVFDTIFSLKFSTVYEKRELQERMRGYVETYIYKVDDKSTVDCDILAYFTSRPTGTRKELL